MSVHPLGGDLLGQLAVSRGLLSPEQLRHLLELHGRPGNQERLGDLMVSQGMISPANLQALVAEQAAMAAGQQPGVMPFGGTDSAEDALSLVQGSALSAPAPAGQPIARVNVAKKTSAQVQAERAAKPAAPMRPKAGKAIPQERGINLDLPDADGDSFEIETTEGARKVDTQSLEGAGQKGNGAPSSGSGRAVRADGPALSARGEDPGVAEASAKRVEAVLATPGGKMMAELVTAAARATASDLHLHTGYPLMIRQNGRLVAGQGAALNAAQLLPAILDLLDRDQRQVWETRGQVELGFVLPNLARCRVQVVQGAEGPSAVFRLVPILIPTLNALGLPGALARLVAASQGLVVIAGPAGCGKSWTLAALVDILNNERREHIVCIERPIEFLHPSKRCVVSQREVPTHASSMSRAVRAALQEDPDVIVIGEIEDAETAKLAAVAAESGRLVLTTVAAGSAVRAVSRLLGMFPSEQQALAGAMLSDALRAVVAQRLVPMADGVRRMAVCEVLEVDGAAAGKIHAGIPHELAPNVPFDESLANAVRTGAITREEARKHAERPEPFT